MQFSASLCCFSLSSWPVAVPVSGLASYSHVFHRFALSPLLLFLFSGLPIDRIVNAVIGLSCILIAANLGSFLITSRRILPKPWIAVTTASCTAIAGLACLFSAVMARSFHPRLMATLPLALALLFVVTATLLPFLLSNLRILAFRLEEAATAARKSEAHFLIAGENTTDALMLLEALRAPSDRIEDFRYTYLNPNAERLLAKPASQVLGARITTILPIEASSALFERFCQVVLTGRPLIHEFPLNPAESDSLWMRHHVARLEDGLAITASDITASRRDVREFHRKDQFDPLTGLPTHLLLEDRIDQAIARAVRYKDKVGIFLLNLDSFQQINERYGRPTGDEVLRVTAARLRSAIRATDTVIRLDGDEFIIVLPEIKLEIDVRRTAATLAASLRRPIVLDGAANFQSIQLTCSIGAAIYPDTARTFNGLLAAADVTIARAKAQGKNQYILYDPVIDDLDVRVTAQRTETRETAPSEATESNHELDSEGDLSQIAVTDAEQYAD